MYNENEISLAEATVLALQGKLKLEETRPARRTRRIKTESKNLEDIQIEIYEMIQTARNVDKQDKNTNIKETIYAIESEYPEIDKRELTRYVRLKADEIYNGNYDESKEPKTESVEIETDNVEVELEDNGDTTIETDKEIITVSQKASEIDLTSIEEPVEDVTDSEETIDVPVEGDETIVPEEEVPEETFEEDNIEDLEESKNLNESNFDSIAELFKQALNENKLMETSAQDNLDRNKKMNEIIQALDNYRGKFPGIEKYMWECILKAAQNGYTECNIKVANLPNSSNLSYTDLAKLLNSTNGLLALMFKHKKMGYKTNNAGPIEYIIISWEDLANRLKFEENKKLQEWMRDDYDFKQFLAYEIGNKSEKLGEQIDTSNFEDNEIVNYVYDLVNDRVDYIIDEAVYKCKEQFLGDKDLEESKSVKTESENTINIQKEKNALYSLGSTLAFIKQSDDKRKQELIQNVKETINFIKELTGKDLNTIKEDLINANDYRWSEIKILDEIIGDIENNIEESKCIKTESKQTFNKKSFEETLTKFYNFNNDNVKSFKVESIMTNKNGSLKIEGKLNDNVSATMIFDKKVEGKSFITYSLRKSNVLKESKEIKTTMMINKKDNILNCRNIISK